MLDPGENPALEGGVLAKDKPCLPRARALASARARFCEVDSVHGICRERLLLTGPFCGTNNNASLPAPFLAPKR